MKKETLNITKSQLKTIKEILRKFVPEIEVRAFGSRLTDKAKDYSDLDLALIGKTRIERKNIVLLKEAFENSDLPFRVDLIDWDRISDGFRKIISRRYKVL